MAHQTDFIILPISHLAWGYAKEKHFQFLKEVHLNFLSAILGNDITSDEKFCELYKSFSEIENALNEFYLQNLIFSGIEDASLPIEERVNSYIKDYLPQLLDKSDSVKFIFATFNMIGQITDILLTSSILNLVPFIRYDVTFRYFLMINSILKEDKDTEMMLNKSILSHLFYESFPTSIFSKIEYSDYTKELNDYNVIKDVYGFLGLKNKNLQDYKLIEVVDAIKSKFNHNVLKNLSKM